MSTTITYTAEGPTVTITASDINDTNNNPYNRIATDNYHIKIDTTDSGMTSSSYTDSLSLSLSNYLNSQSDLHVPNYRICLNNTGSVNRNSGIFTDFENKWLANDLYFTVSAPTTHINVGGYLGVNPYYACYLEKDSYIKTAWRFSGPGKINPKNEGGTYDHDYGPYTLPSYGSIFVIEGTHGMSFFNAKVRGSDNNSHWILSRNNNISSPNWDFDSSSDAGRGAIPCHLTAADYIYNPNNNTYEGISNVLAIVIKPYGTEAMNGWQVRVLYKDGSNYTRRIYGDTGASDNYANPVYTWRLAYGGGYSPEAGNNTVEAMTAPCALTFSYELEVV